MLISFIKESNNSYKRSLPFFGALRVLSIVSGWWLLVDGVLLVSLLTSLQALVVALSETVTLIGIAHDRLNSKLKIFFNYSKSTDN
ncbi:hypothetical protein EOPP23_17105 [Endozoicomonas sp. OPT23]|nr:hypothetical protein [Endozoicomonas sp. OPT23]